MTTPVSAWTGASTNPSKHCPARDKKSLEKKRDFRWSKDGFRNSPFESCPLFQRLGHQACSSFGGAQELVQAPEILGVQILALEDGGVVQRHLQLLGGGFRQNFLDDHLAVLKTQGPPGGQPGFLGAQEAVQAHKETIGAAKDQEISVEEFLHL